MQMNLTYLQNVRMLGVIEGISTLILFGIAMPLKYAAGMPLAVTFAGTIHGFLFLSLAVLLLLGVKKVPFSVGFAAMGILATVLPFGPFIFDRWLVELQDNGGEIPASQE